MHTVKEKNKKIIKKNKTTEEQSSNTISINNDKISQQLLFWGVRGTIPTPGTKTLKYGGNTSCVEIVFDEEDHHLSLILDAGSGIIACGERGIARGDREFHIFLSHVHYDHLIGLTKFTPIFRRDCKVTFYGLRSCGKSLDQVLDSFFSHPLFPVEFGSLGAKPNLNFHTITENDSIALGKARIKFQYLNHPQGAVAFRITNAQTGISVVYATDHEHGTKYDEELINFAKNATLFIYDSTFYSENYTKFKGWGHSTSQMGAQIAKNANVKFYALFHYDPEANDEILEKILLKEATDIFPNSFLAEENTQIDLLKLINFKGNISEIISNII